MWTGYNLFREQEFHDFDEMRLVFEAHGGTIQKIIGDAIVVVYLRDGEDHVTSATLDARP